MSDRYILDEHGEPVAEPDLMLWADWMQDHPRHVAQDQIGDARVSTVFLGLNHAVGNVEPLLFETMIFGGEHDQYQARYSRRADAIVGHAIAVAMVRSEPPDKGAAA